MEENNLHEIQPWEQRCARLMGKNGQLPLEKAVEMIREVTVDSDGNRILSPEEYLDKIKDMSEREKQEFGQSLIEPVKDPASALSYPIPKSLAADIQWMMEKGIRPYGIDSGRLADRPNHRDDRGFPLQFTSIGRPIAYITFKEQESAGTRAYYCNHKQIEDIKQAAREAGWCAGPLDSSAARGKYCIVTLPLSNDGKLTITNLSNEVTKGLGVMCYPEQVQETLDRHGGRKYYTDAQLGIAWSRLTQAIVNKAEQRIAQENERISDVQITKVLDKVQQTAVHYIRCKVDGQQQLRQEMTKTDGGRYDVAVFHNDEKALDELKAELGRTYFQEQLYQQALSVGAKR